MVQARTSGDIMRIKNINEDLQHQPDPEDVVEELEELVDSRQGKLNDTDVAYITKLLGRYDDRFRKKIAVLLGTADYSPGGMANQIAKGALIAYIDDAQINARLQPAREDLAEPEMDENHPDYYFDGPGRAELEAMENPGQHDFNNSPPAFKPQEGGVDLALIPEMVQARFSRLSPADLIDNPPTMPAVHQPFIYAGGRLYVGMKNGYHGSAIIDLASGKTEALLQNVYYGGEYDRMGDYVPGSGLPGVVGRTGYNFSRMDKSLRHVAAAVLYAKRGTVDNPAVVGECVRALVSEGYIPRDGLIVYAGQLTTAQEMAGGGKMEASEEDVLRSELQAAYHVGTWPNGKRMTPQEKAALGRQLGIVGGGKKNPWQDNMEKAGIVKPGQRWWAPYSEDKVK